MSDSRFQPGDGELVEILRTDDAGFLPVVKSLFEASGIPYLIQGDEALGLIPTGILSSGFPRPLICAIVRVPQAYEEEARALLDNPAVELEPDDIEGPED